MKTSSFPIVAVVCLLLLALIPAGSSVSQDIPGRASLSTLPVGSVQNPRQAGDAVADTYAEMPGGAPQLGQETPGSIQGLVRDRTGEALVGASVLLRGTRIGVSTDIQGRYLIPRVRPGVQTVEVSYVGCALLRREVPVRAGETVTLDFVLEQSSFMIGAIECVGGKALLPADAQTKTLITGAEVEHFQASSIGDVLDLVPGIQKTENPGLGKTSQIAVRSAQDDFLSAFGTLVMVDGIPISNNANLQFERYSEGATGPSNLGGGADLRLIPADNVQMIEVISGVPSVRYGDVTSGVINVQTRIGPQPNRLKIKNNPDTREANLGGGFLLGTTGLSYNLNAAQSERDIRKDGDEYLRLTGQAVFSSNFFDDQLTVNTKLFGQRVFDEEEPRGDVQQTRNYNRGYSLSFSSWGKYAPADAVSNLEYNGYVTFRKENTMKSRLVQSDVRILPSGDTISTYLGKVETHGNEWTIGGRLDWNRVFFLGDFVHRTLVGAEIQYNANTGEGVVVDSIFNYYGSQSGKTSYRFDDIPGQVLASLYAEDRFTGTLGAEFHMTLGFRYEMYRPNGFNLKGLYGDGDLVRSRSGSYFNPRMSLLVYLSDVNQVRLSAGFSSKSPAMSYMYPEPSVLRWRNPVENRTEYFRRDTRVTDLRGYREGQVELSYDHKFFGVLGTTISTYYKKRTGEPRSQSYPIFAYSVSGPTTTAYFVDTYGRYENIGASERKGVEAVLRTGQIQPLNMEFQVVGSYTFEKYSSRGFSFDSSPDQSVGQIPNYRATGVPVDTLIGFVYPTGGRWEDRILLNYYLKYTVPRLGLWVTLRAEQALLSRYQYQGLEPVDYSLLTPSSKEQRDFDESIRSKYVKWLFNLNISKALWRGAEVSFYVNNLLDDPALRRYQVSATTWSDEIRNPQLFYGIEFSMVVDELVGGGAR